MCGIAGFLGDFDPTLLGRMNALQSHRGPDGEGELHLAATGVGLAHRRLAIIDLSERAAQPMWDASKSAVVTFNGEIFNYRQLRETLVRHGYRFQTASDTEVLLNMYLEYGTDMLPMLNGQFAFALWDARRGELLVARDGPGVIPLYHATDHRGFLFASEMKALVAAGVDRSLDPAAVEAYVTYLWCPAPRTMLRSVAKLPPGSALLVADGRIQKSWRFYDLPFDQPPDLDIAPEDAAEAVRSALDRAVERQMVADVPVGAFLSGGLDSSSIAAAARHHSTSRLQCFTIDLGGEWGREGFVEDAPYARRVAAHLDVDLHTTVADADAIHDFEHLVYHLDEPQADPAPLFVYHIARLARERGIKVLLSGVGGDDIFSGYRRHFALRADRYAGAFPRPLRRAARLVTDRLDRRRPWARRLARAAQYIDADPDERIVGYFRWIHPTDFGALRGPALSDGDTWEPLRASLDELPATVPPLHRMLYLEAKHFLNDHNLNYTNKMAMATGVEVRVPFLDPDLVTLAARLPPDMKLRGRHAKWVLKKAMEPVLPSDVIYRSKTGFGAPIRRWLQQDLVPVRDDLLGSRSLHARGLFDPTGVADLVEADGRGLVDASYPILAMMLIELWCRRFVDSPVV